MRTLGCKGGACKEPLMKTKYRCFEKGNLELPFNLSQPLLGLSPEKMRIKKSFSSQNLQQHLLSLRMTGDLVLSVPSFTVSFLLTHFLYSNYTHFNPDPICIYLGILCMLFPLPAMFFPPVSEWLPVFHPSHFCSHVPYQ